ncbi:hydrolase [uncultured Maribacter sp.]|uniref:hydrolase n=1 Tax=uncultured Maribacter sp. TaxID=431308 RepID=UPI002622BFD5|nr:hydrolase [uncultured Maribacter sp.]
MKNRLFLYLFIFSALIALYFFVSSGKMVDSYEARIKKQEIVVEQLKDSLQTTTLKALEMQYFSLENNDDALAYYDHLNIEDSSNYIADKLLETNESKGSNPLVPYEGMENDFKINKIKILNHKWIIADFSDGKYWGEILVKYELKDDLGVDFSLVDHLLYTRSN